jgi:hypothetical protein
MGSLKDYITKTPKFDRWTLSLTLSEIILAAVVFAAIYGVGMGYELSYSDNKFFPVGFNPYRDLAYRYLFIAILLVISAAIVWLSRLVLVRIAALAPIAVAIWQCKFLVESAGEMPVFPRASLVSQANLDYLGYLFLAMTTILIGMHATSFWNQLRDLS